MKPINLILITVLYFLLAGCKASVDDSTTDSASSRNGAEFVGHCSKYLIVHKKKAKVVNAKSSSKEEKTVIDSAVEASEGARDADVAKEKRQDEQAFFVSYTVEEDAAGNRQIKCSLTDGGHEYKNDAKLSGSHAYLTRNYCDIVYDLDGDNSFGTFTFEYSQDWAWIHYNDEEADYSFDVKFRNAECIQFDK